MPDTFAHVATVAAAIEDHWPIAPKVGIILGSGLGGLADRIEEATAIDYADLPHFPQSTAIGHAGRLVCGALAGVSVIAMQGRFHLYEGHPADRVAFPVRVMNALGASVLVVSNAAGGINPQYQVGDIMVIDDHVNLMFRNPLVAENDPRLGPRWPDMCAPYDREFGDQALAIARRHDFVCHRGVYVGMLGPTYETRAEYRMVRRLGGDVVGMSTVPEVIVAAQLGMRVLGLSTVTNACCPDQLGETSGEEVVAAAASAADKLTTIVEGIVGEMAEPV
ncbi:purine-nucleoside phosphorylase [Aeoliella sp. ICT_H6.2]|uniref:Purine nucleoside phosphorylase n=1 Tax=Aeoliella straminimaris TaxID=2954799 RepID=A0A9X2JK45_9BACT|nr:purine-nucleoside phosphorylase [Aeoliella straminimaris]MCO6047608.1 purine-nucleoside phosphorylase [Aeoliella straminimaris]